MPVPENQPKKKMGTGVKVALGCGAAVLVVIIIGLVAMFLGFRWAMGKVNEMAAPFEERGFERVSSQQVVVRQPVAKDTVYVAQIVRIEADVEAEVALVCQMAEITGTMKEKVWFRGQILVIHPGAVLEGGLDAKAQVVQNNGAIEKELTATVPVVGTGTLPAEEEDGEMAPATPQEALPE